VDGLWGGRKVYGALGDDDDNGREGRREEKEEKTKPKPKGTASAIQHVTEPRLPASVPFLAKAIFSKAILAATL
jgi:hypothetical protein